MASSKWTGFFAFFLGASLGVVAGMLLAPKSGEDLREDLNDRLNEGAKRVRATSRSVARRAQEMASEVQQRVSDRRPHFLRQRIDADGVDHGFRRGNARVAIEAQNIASIRRIRREFAGRKRNLVSGVAEAIVLADRRIGRISKRKINVAGGISREPAVAEKATRRRASR